MSKIIRLTESELIRIIENSILEQVSMNSSDKQEDSCKLELTKLGVVWNTKQEDDQNVGSIRFSKQEKGRSKTFGIQVAIDKNKYLSICAGNLNPNLNIQNETKSFYKFAKSNNLKITNNNLKQTNETGYNFCVWTHYGKCNMNDPSVSGVAFVKEFIKKLISDFPGYVKS